MKVFITLALLFLAVSVSGQQKFTQAQYSADKEKLNETFYGSFVPSFKQFYSLPQSVFVKKMDSLKAPFSKLIHKYEKHLGASFAQTERIDNSLFMDQFIVNYPLFHQEYTKINVGFSKYVTERLKRHQVDFNKPEYLKLNGYNEYVDAVIHLYWVTAIKKGKFANSDNKKLDAIFASLPGYFTNRKCLEYWQYTYLKYHIDNFGIKNIGKLYHNFINNCADTSYKNVITNMYNVDLIGRQDHLIIPYKTVGGYSLDIHLFLPDPNKFRSANKPLLVYFHGGSWTEGKPDWFFGTCKYDTSRGWAAAAVEYRIGDRHGTLPFESVKDAKSAIRWLRTNADKYKFNKNMIVASGNSAGGHLALCTILVDDYNESTDNLSISAQPNLVMVNSAVYDLTVNNDWISADFNKPDSVKGISPVYLIKKIKQPILIIHGTQDNNVPYWTAAKFVKEMQGIGNQVEFKPFQDSGHFLWYDPRFSAKADSVRGAFLEVNGIK